MGVGGGGGGGEWREVEIQHHIVYWEEIDPQY